MLCESCGKNEANLHYTKVVNGKVEERHLCQECASMDYDFNFNNLFSMHKLFTGLIDSKAEDDNMEREYRCENCGLKYSDFKSEGKLGCAQCYETFKEELNPIIKGLHGHNINRGKIPKRSNERVYLKREEDSLKIRLENAVKMEEFEEAAMLRDELKELRCKLNSFKG